MTTRMMIICIIFAIGCLFLENNIAYIQGIVGGGLYSILNLTLLKRTIEKSLRMEPNKAKIYAFISYFFRYIITGALLIAIVLYSKEMFYGTILGLISRQLSIYSLSIKKSL